MPPDRSPPCPICGRLPPVGMPGAARLLPFCSRRCADVDLGRWMTGQYVVPARDDAEEDGPGTRGAEPAAQSGREP